MNDALFKRSAYFSLQIIPGLLYLRSSNILTLLTFIFSSFFLSIFTYLYSSKKLSKSPKAPLTVSIMTGTNKRGIVTCVEEDRISNLPEHLIDLILERVPLQDAVRTSIISKKWRYKWTTMKALNFDEQFFKRLEKNGAFGGNEFIEIMNQVLILYKGPISKFHLFIPDIFLDNFQEVDEWMLFLSRNSVKELTISNENQRYELPSHVFTCLELEKLQLEDCFFNPPLDFKGFLNLEDLFLYHIDFGVNLPGTTQIKLPQLKKLSIQNCTNVKNFNIKATKLQKLSVIDCPDAMLSRLLHSPCLMTLGIFYLDSIQVEGMNFVTMLSKLPKIEDVFITADLFKCFFAEKIQKWLPHSVNSLKRLQVVNFEVDDLNHLHGVFCLLRNSPNLETLVLLMLHMQEPEIVDNEVEALNDLEAPNCLDCTLNELKSVEITFSQGSKLELLFMKILLAHSPSLNKFTIEPIGIFDAQKRVEIGKDVMQFPRASPKAELIYLNPES